MNTNALQILEEIGIQLDNGQFPCVHNGGIVMPSKAAISYNALGKEKSDAERQAKTRSTAGSRKRTARRQGASRRCREARDASPLINAKVRKNYLRDLKRVTKAYPAIKVWDTPTGLWLRAPAMPVQHSNREVTFLIFLPYPEGLPLKAWAFWSSIMGYTWIGPRHTNAPDGSICAFEPGDHSWQQGDKIVRLLDIFCVWAVRHLHLEKIGRWPGYQAVPHPYERLMEVQDNEYCGCDNAGRRYADCCKQDDLALDHESLRHDFEAKYGHSKVVPKVIKNFVEGSGPLPVICYPSF